MFYAENEQLLNAAFEHITRPFFQCEERDSYTGEIRLFDRDEIGAPVTTELGICDDGYYVTVRTDDDYLIDEQHYDDIREALEAYNRQTAQPIANELTIKDPVSGENVTVAVTDSEDIDGGTFHEVHYDARTSAEVDCDFAVIEYDDGSFVCQPDWQGEIADYSDIPATRWVDCTPADAPEELTATEAAAELGISRQAVHGLIQRGKLGARRERGVWLITRESVDNRK